MSVSRPILIPPALYWAPAEPAASRTQRAAALRIVVICKSSVEGSNGKVVEQLAVARADFGAGQRLLHFAVHEQGVPVGQREREMQVLLDQQHRHALRLQPAQDLL